jgi:hypoxanthine phosphoribosyltransferase
LIVDINKPVSDFIQEPIGRFLSDVVERIGAAGKDILLLDGILQSGVTLDHLYRYILGQNPASVRTALLVEKTDERKVAVATDYVGFRTAGKFLVGYGLGYQEKYRNLPYVAALG